MRTYYYNIDTRTLKALAYTFLVLSMFALAGHGDHELLMAGIIH